MAKVRQFKPEDIKRRDTTRRVMNKTSDIRIENGISKQV